MNEFHEGSSNEMKLKQVSKVETIKETADNDEVAKLKKALAEKDLLIAEREKAAAEEVARREREAAEEVARKEREAAEEVARKQREAAAAEEVKYKNISELIEVLKSGTAGGKVQAAAALWILAVDVDNKKVIKEKYLDIIKNALQNETNSDTKSWLQKLFNNIT